MSAPRDPTYDFSAVADLLERLIEAGHTFDATPPTEMTHPVEVPRRDPNTPDALPS